MIEFKYSRIALPTLRAAFLSQILKRLNASVAPRATLVRSRPRALLFWGSSVDACSWLSIWYEVGIGDDCRRLSKALLTPGGISFRVCGTFSSPVAYKFEVGETFVVAALRAVLVIIELVIRLGSRRPTMCVGPPRLRA